MPNVVLECALGNECTKGEGGGIWKTPSAPADTAIKLIEQHVKYAHQNAVAGPEAAVLKAEKLVRPTIQIRGGVIEDEEWEYFLHRWNTYKTQANLTVATKSHLESCLGNDITVVLFGRLGQESRLMVSSYRENFT